MTDIYGFENDASDDVRIYVRLSHVTKDGENYTKVRSYRIDNIRGLQRDFFEFYISRSGAAEVDLLKRLAPITEEQYVSIFLNTPFEEK